MKTFLDDDYVPPDPQSFNAGREAERKRANSKEEQARIKKIGEEIGQRIAAGFKEIIQ